MASLLLRYHTSTADGAVSLPLLKLCTQLNIVLHASVFSPQIANNRRRTSDGVTSSFHRIHGVHLLPVIITFHFETLVQALRLPDVGNYAAAFDWQRRLGPFCGGTVYQDYTIRWQFAPSHSLLFARTAAPVPIIPNALLIPITVIFTHVARKPARYRALASIIPGRERLSWNLSF